MPAEKMALIGESYLNHINMPIKRDGEPEWVTVTVPDPIEVMEGDIIGMFYDKLRMKTEELTIPSTINPKQKPDVIVILADSGFFQRTSKFLQKLD